MKRLLIALLIPSLVLAQPSPPPLVVEEADTAVTRPTYNIDFQSCFDVSAASTEANISFDSSECTVNADALKANGANCSAGNYPLGVDASGAAESCTADDDVPESGDLAAATLQVVTTAGATSNVATTFSGGLDSLAGGVAGSLQLGSTLSGGASAGNINIGTDQTIPSAGIVHAIGSYNTFSGADHIAFVYGYGNDIYRLTSPGGANTAIGYFNDLGYGYSSTVIGEDNICRMTESAVIGFSNFVAPTATLAAEVPNQAAVVGSGNVIGVNTDVTTIVGQANSVGANLAQGPSIVGKSNTVTHESVSVLGNNITSTAASRAYLGDSTQTAVISEAYTLPLADGSASQYLKTNGAGATSFDTLDLGTDTTGDYVATVADGTGIDGTATGEGSTYTPTLDLTEINDHTFGNATETPITVNYDTSSATGAAEWQIDGTEFQEVTTNSASGIPQIGWFGTAPTLLSFIASTVVSGGANPQSKFFDIDFDYAPTSSPQPRAAVMDFTMRNSAQSSTSGILQYLKLYKSYDRSETNIGFRFECGTDLTTAASDTTNHTCEGFRFLPLNATAGANTAGTTTMNAVHVSPAPNNYFALTYNAWLSDGGNAIWNENGDANSDFRIESDTSANMFFLDASTDFIGIKDGTPSFELDVNGRVFQQGCPTNFTRFGLGCIQTDEEGNGTWDVAREDCYDTYGGRLPTPHELMIAANNLTLTNETDDEEWTNEINYDAAAVECGYLKLNAGTADESADYADQACGTAESYRCFVPFAGGI